MSKFNETKRQMWADLYRLAEARDDMGDTYEDWDATNKAAKVLLEKYEDDKYFRGLMCGLYNALENERRKTDEQILANYGKEKPLPQ